jgi:hypothetical protein
VVTVCTICLNVIGNFILPTECIHGFLAVLSAFISLNHINQSIFIMEECSVFFEVGTEFNKRYLATA